MVRRAARLGAVAGLVLLGLLSASCRRKPVAKNVILFIGDGMGAQTEVAAGRYLTGRDDGLSWHAFPVKTFVATWDVNVYNANARAAHRPPFSISSFVPSLGYDVRARGARPREGEDAWAPYPLGPATDSASAATAIATGVKTDSGNVAWLPGDPPDGALLTIAEELRAERGKAIGIVTTVPFNHATPAAFVSHNTSRNAYYTGFKGYQGWGLADEIILKTKPDVVIGGGHPGLDNPAFDPRKGYISRSLYLALQSSPDTLVVERVAGVDGGLAVLEAAPAAARTGRRLFGLFGGPGGNFEIPVAVDSPGAPLVRPATEENPSLAEAAVAALERLSADPDGFFLVIEQGDIDWANHDNDFRAMIGCAADLDAAVRAVVAFIDRPGDGIDGTNTLLVVTADHATGGLCLNPRKKLGPGDLPRQVPRIATESASGSDRGMANGTSLKTDGFVSPYIYPDDEVAFTTLGHTDELVNLAAFGAGARFFLRYRGTWYPGPIIDNTQINAALRRALGLPPVGRHPRRVLGPRLP